MTTKTKLIVGALLAGVIGSTIGYTIFSRNRGVVAVQVGRVIRRDLTQSVTANGEVKPKKYVNISANTMGRIVRMPVKEGDRVSRGDLLLRLDSVQTQADVSSAEANLDAAQAELEGMSASSRSSDAAVSTAKAELARSEADLIRNKQNFGRAERLSKDGLISQEQFDRSKADFDVATAQVSSARARLSQAEAQVAQVLKQSEGLSLRLNQQRAALVRARDQFSKTTISSPLDGIITYLPVNEGEIAIIGVQNQPGTVLMTIADMSVITAEVRVDETDIVNVRVGQEAQVRVDALGDQLLLGHVSEIGNSALSRTGSLPNGPTNSQEAKDFKVVITLDNPSSSLRPGLSCTATIVTATRNQALTIPIQALTVRELDDTAPAETSETGPVTSDAIPTQSRDKKKVEREGIFVVKNGVALFRSVRTGIIGTTDIELIDGLVEGEQIVTGSYQILRNLKDNTRVKVDKQP